jgi:hypothetical protein
MMKVRINPEAPTREPAIMSAEFPIMNPVNAAAIPDNELRSETTTGMSAPPIGRTNTSPSKHEMPIILHRYVVFVGSSMLR